MNTYETIDLNDYVQTGEGGTALTYTHKTRPTMAKLFNPGNEAELAEKEFLTARAVFEMGIPTPEPLRLVTDSQRQGVEYELISNKRSFTRIISQEPERLEEISLAFARMARELHETKADTTHFPSVKETLRRFYKEKGDRVLFSMGRFLMKRNWWLRLPFVSVVGEMNPVTWTPASV